MNILLSQRFHLYINSPLLIFILMFLMKTVNKTLLHLHSYYCFTVTNYRLQFWFQFIYFTNTPTLSWGLQLLSSSTFKQRYTNADTHINITHLCVLTYNTEKKKYSHGQKKPCNLGTQLIMHVFNYFFNSAITCFLRKFEFLYICKHAKLLQKTHLI